MKEVLEATAWYMLLKFEYKLVKNSTTNVHKYSLMPLHAIILFQTYTAYLRITCCTFFLQIILDVPTVGGRLMLVDMAGSENIEQAGQAGFEAKMQVPCQKNKKI